MSWIGSALALSLLGGLHCAGMCGGFAIITLSKAPKWRISKSFLLYTLGKTSSYAVAGAVFGGLGSVFHHYPLGSRVLAGMTGVALILIGLEMAGFPLFWSQKQPSATGWIRSTFSKVTQSLSPTNSYVMGLLNGLLPCGLLYAAFAGAASTGSAATGALFMAVFGIGTIPMLFLTAQLLSSISTSTRGKVIRLAGWSLVLFGTVWLYRGIAEILPMSH